MSKSNVRPKIVHSGLAFVQLSFWPGGEVGRDSGEKRHLIRFSASLLRLGPSQTLFLRHQPKDRLGWKLVCAPTARC